jgi:hypothetical protein
MEPDYLLAQECSAQEWEEICRWTAERVWKRLDAWKNGVEPAARITGVFAGQKSRQQS